MICYDYINEYIRSTIEPSSGILAELEEYAEKNHVPIVEPEVARLISVIGSVLRPAHILEAGTAIGYSAILMSQFLRADGHIDTIERYDRMIEIARENIKRAGLVDIINVIVGDALDVMQCLNKKYDLIFLDAAKGQYQMFLPEALRMLNKGGLLISDNILFRGMVANDKLVIRRKKTIVKRMRGYLSELCDDNRLKTSIIPIGDGVALSFKK